MTNHEPQNEEQVEKTVDESKDVKEVSISAEELQKLRSEAGDLKDKYLRVLAEAENAKKRLQKEKHDLSQFAVQNVILDFLNPIDHMENALKFTNQMSQDVKHWAIGFQMILSQFKDVLASNGVHPFTSEGEPFDPHFHEAIEMIETPDYAEGIVVEETLRGYKMGERIIRPARVKVSKHPAPQVSDEAEQEEVKEEN